MDNKIFLSTKNKFIEIKEEELRINGIMFKEKVGDTTVEYKLSHNGITETVLTKKALKLSQD